MSLGPPPRSSICGRKVELLQMRDTNEEVLVQLQERSPSL